MSTPRRPGDDNPSEPGTRQAPDLRAALASVIEFLVPDPTRPFDTRVFTEVVAAFGSGVTASENVDDLYVLTRYIDGQWRMIHPREQGFTVVLRDDLTSLLDELAPARLRIWLSTAEAADRVGVTTRTLYRFINEGNLTAYRFGRVMRLDALDVEEFIQRQRVQPGDLDHLVGADEGDEASPDDPG